MRFPCRFIRGSRVLAALAIIWVCAGTTSGSGDDPSASKGDRQPFVIKVVDDAGLPVAGASIALTYQTNDFEAVYPVADKQGTAHIDRRPESLVLEAATTDRSRAGMVRADTRASEARIVVKPTAGAEGRLIAPDGKPLGNHELLYGIRVHTDARPNSPFFLHFGGKTRTESDGRFRIPGLVVGERYDLYMNLSQPGQVRFARENLRPKAPNVTDLGDVVIDLSPPKPRVAPTPRSRAGDSFAALAEKTPRERFEFVQAEADREYTRPLILMGKPDDPACIELFRLFYNEPDGDEATVRKSPAVLRWEYELLSLDPLVPGVKPLLESLGIARTGEVVPQLIIPEHEGRPAAAYALRPGPDGKLDATALGAFLLEHRRPTRDARVMLAEGLAKAKATDRRVFLIASASWCGPCRRLARFLDANKEELERYFVFVKLDENRDRHARELVGPYQRKGDLNGVPWYVILDEAGAALATSNAEEAEGDAVSTNIGFPTTRGGIEHFSTMLRRTAPRLSEERLDALLRQLGKQP